MKIFFQIMGIIYTILLTISIILYIANMIKNHITVKQFEESIKKTSGLKKTFDKLDSKSLEKLDKTNNITEKTIDLKSQSENNSDIIMEKFKDYQIEDMDSLIDELMNYLRRKTGISNAVISDWFSIIRKDGTHIDDFTFEVHSKNIFAIFSKKEGTTGRIITNICAFKEISDFIELLDQKYNCDRFDMDSVQKE